MTRRQIMEAGELCADHIGDVVRFRTYDQDRAITTVTTAELRQVNHDLEGTSIRVGLMAEAEFVLDHDQSVSIAPPSDYSDMETLNP